jgi:hypothetical protein
MKNIGQNAGLGMASIERHPNAFPQIVQVFGEPPQLQLRDQANLVAKIKKRAVSFGCAAQIQPRFIGRSRRGRRKAEAPNLLYQIHFIFRAFQTLRPARIVINDPFWKSDGAGNYQSGIIDPLL